MAQQASLLKSAALQLCKRREFEPGQSFICNIEQDQSPDKVTQYETPLTSYRLQGYDLVAIGKSLLRSAKAVVM